MDSEKVTSTSPDSQDRKSTILRLIDAHTLDTEVFRIALPNKNADPPFLTFRNYKSPQEITEFKAKASLFSKKFQSHAAKDERLKRFIGQVNEQIVYESWLLGNLCVTEDLFDDGNLAGFLTLAVDAPLLYQHIVVAVDEACFGNEAVLFNEEVEAAKKD